MSEQTTIARPYAKALFDLARDHQQLSAWGEVLAELAVLVSCQAMIDVIDDPRISPLQRQTWLLACLSKNSTVTAELTRFIALLASHKRLLLLADIASQYEQLRAIEEQRMRVVINSYAPLSKKHATDLAQSLSKRYGRAVELDVVVDESLLGGLVIKADGEVIDGSLRAKLKALSMSLIA